MKLLGGEGACVKIRGHQHYPDQSHTDPGPYWNWNYYYKLINEGTPIIRLGGAGATEGELNYVNYGDDERVIWVIESDPCTRIALDFSSFDLEDDYDFLWIYDGDNVYARKIGRWNTQSPNVVTSSGNAMCVEFRSDCATTATGWRAHWRVLHDYSLIEDFNMEQEECVLTAFDMLGRIVLERRVQGNDDHVLLSLPQGVYLVRFTKVSDGSVMIKRIIR